MGARLHHTPLVEHHDAIGALGGAQAMGDERACVEAGAAELGQHLLFLGRVHVGEDVVEHEQRRRAGERPGQRDPLALAARQREPALADDGVPPLGEARDLRRRPPRPPPPRARRPGSTASRPSVTLSTSAREKRNASCGTQASAARSRPSESVVTSCAADEDGAGRRLPQPREQQTERGLAAARRTHDGHHLARPHLERHVAQHRRPTAVGEGEPVEADRRGERLRRAVAALDRAPAAPGRAPPGCAPSR